MTKPKLPPSYLFWAHKGKKWLEHMRKEDQDSKDKNDADNASTAVENHTFQTGEKLQNK